MQVMIATHIDSALSAAASPAKRQPKVWPVRVFIKSDDPSDDNWLCIDLLGERQCPAELRQLGERSRRESEEKDSPAAAIAAASLPKSAAEVPLFVVRYLASNISSAMPSNSTAAQDQFELLTSSGHGLSVLEVSASPAEIKEAAHQLNKRAQWLAPSFVASIAGGEAFPPVGCDSADPSSSNSDSSGSSGGNSSSSGVERFDMGLLGNFALAVIHPHIDWGIPRCALLDCRATVSKQPEDHSGDDRSSNHTAVHSAPSWSKLKRCGACRAVWYCCKAHQLAHWRSGHRRLCGHSPDQLTALLGKAVAGSPEVPFLKADRSAVQAAYGACSDCSVGSGDRSCSADNVDTSSPRTWRAGTCVAIEGLTAAPALNGTRGVVVRHNCMASRGRVEVRLATCAATRASRVAGKHFEVRPENLVAL